MFNQQQFHQRFKKMGDEAESIFEDWSKMHNIEAVRLGLNRPPFEFFHNLPVQIRFLPDYIIEDTKRYIRDNKGPLVYAHGFAEVKGVGKDQLVKMKSEMLLINQELEKYFKRQVVYFIWDKHKRRVSFSHTNRDITELITEHDIVEKQFHEGNRYHPVPTDLLEWDYELPSGW